MSPGAVVQRRLLGPTDPPVARTGTETDESWKTCMGDGGDGEAERQIAALEKRNRSSLQPDERYEIIDRVMADIARRRGRKSDEEAEKG